MLFLLPPIRPLLARAQPEPSIDRTPLADLTPRRGVVGTTLGVLALLGLYSQAAAQPSSLPATPPSGDYEITTSIMSNSCRDKFAAAAPFKGVVYIKTMKTGYAGNLPLPAMVPPSGAGKSAVVERSDLQLEPGKKMVFTSSSQPRCPRYKTTHTLELLEVTRERLKLRRTTEYGDGSGCTDAPLPTRCAVASEHVYTLQKASCEVPCSGQGKTDPKGGQTMQCICPSSPDKPAAGANGSAAPGVGSPRSTVSAPLAIFVGFQTTLSSTGLVRHRLEPTDGSIALARQAHEVPLLILLGVATGQARLVLEYADGHSEERTLEVRPGSPPGAEKLQLRVGQVHSGHAATHLKSFSAAASALLDVKVAPNNQDYLLRAIKPGTTSIMLLQEDGSTQQKLVEILP